MKTTSHSRAFAHTLAFARTLAFALAALAAPFALAACLDDPAELRPVEAPRFAYDSVVTFTVGAFARHEAASTGGAAISWSIAPALPAGLSLSATGAILGLPSEADTGQVYVVTAKGPGGNGRDTLRLRILPETVDPAIARPAISLASPANDTVGKAASHAVVSTGGPATGYAVLPALPPGLVLDVATGAVTGTPTKAYGRDAYAIIAFGPGGRDTATLDLAVHAPSPADAPRLEARVRFHAASEGAPSAKWGTPSSLAKNAALRKSAATAGNLLPSVTLKRMLVTVTSNLGDTLRDTIAAGSQGLPLKIDTTRAFTKEYVLPKTERAWKIAARVFDARDSLIFADSGAAVAGAGFARDTLDLVARYIGYRATYLFPDSIRSASTARAWPLVLKRLTLQVGAATVFDTSAAAGFRHGFFVEYPYLRPQVSYTLSHSVRGSVAGRADTVIYQGSASYLPTRESSNLPLNYVGPTDLP